MKYVSLEERKIQKEQEIKFYQGLVKDIHSTKSYSEKKYLQEFNKILENDKHNNKCTSKHNEYHYNGCEFFNNHYGPNNVHISGLIYSNYYGHCTSLF